MEYVYGKEKVEKVNAIKQELAKVDLEHDYTWTLNDYKEEKGWNICKCLNETLDRLNINNVYELYMTLIEYIKLLDFLKKHRLRTKDIYKMVDNQEDLISLVETLVPLLECHIAFKIVSWENSEVEYQLFIGNETYDINEYQYDVLKNSGARELEHKWW